MGIYNPILSAAIQNNTVRIQLSISDDTVYPKNVNNVAVAPNGLIL